MKFLKSLAMFIGSAVLACLAIAYFADLVERVKEINSLLSTDSLEEE